MTVAAGCRVSSGVTCAMNQRLKDALHVWSSPCTSCSPTACAAQGRLLAATAKPHFVLCTKSHRALLSPP